MDTLDPSHICRACLEPSNKIYPLVGAVVNVNVDIAEMISYCLPSKIEITDNLPNGVCVPCFRSIRISYNFFRQFNESQEKLRLNISKGQIHGIAENDKEAEIGGQTIDTTLEQIQSYLEGNDLEDDVGINDLNSDSEQIENRVDENDLEDQIGINCLNGNIEIINLDEISESLDYDGENNEISNLRYVLNNIKTEENLPGSENVIIEEFIVPDKSVKKRNAPSVEKKESEPLSIYYCPLCEKRFYRFNNFEGHLRSHDKKFICCDKCPSSAKLSVSQYTRHYKKHHRYYCLICKKSLLSSYGFRYHKMQHNDERKFACKHCPKTFFLYHLLKKHMLIHSDNFKHKCNLCGAEFKSYDTYRYHQVTHDGKRRFLCTLCGKRFYQSVHLRDHIYRHTGYKQFSCDTCGKAFTTNSQLKKHLKHCNGSRKRKRN